MLDFGLGIDMQSTTAPVVLAVQQEMPVVTETVRIIPVVSQGASFVMKVEDAWGWSDLRDYVITEIEKRHGAQVRDPLKEAGIFKSFMTRWPEQAVAIAKVAFGPVYDGMWQHAPISVNRFCKASDPFFSKVIADRL